MPSPILPTTSYVITRRVGADADEDPTGTLEFWPAKGSDELYEALKEAFPAYRTHKERMREAVLDFLLQEREQDAMQSVSRSISNASATASFNTMPESAMPSPAYFMQHQQSQGSFQTTPEYLPSPESQFTNTFPSTPATAVTEAEQISAIPNSMTVPGLREMTTVWSVSSGSQPKVRTRRAMTDAEKKEYRRKRLDGACNDCRRRRRKCDHDSSESESSSKCVKRARKAGKAATGTTAKQKGPAAAQHFLEQSSTATSSNQMSFNMSLSQQTQQQDAMLDPAFSLVWPEDKLFDFTLGGMDTLPDADLFKAPADAFLEFFDFDACSSDAERHPFEQDFRVAEETYDSDVPRPQPQHVPSSGMIVPLPSYYARMAVSQDHASSGGTANLPISPTNTLLAAQQQRQQLQQQQPIEGVPGELQDQDKPRKPDRSDDGVNARTLPQQEILRPEGAHDGRPIPPRIEGTTGVFSWSNILHSDCCQCGVTMMPESKGFSQLPPRPGLFASHLESALRRTCVLCATGDGEDAVNSSNIEPQSQLARTHSRALRVRDKNHSQVSTAGILPSQIRNHGAGSAVLIMVAATAAVSAAAALVIAVVLVRLLASSHGGVAINSVTAASALVTAVRMYGTSARGTDKSHGRRTWSRVIELARMGAAAER